VFGNMTVEGIGSQLVLTLDQSKIDFRDNKMVILLFLANGATILENVI
jgi:uncharacterized protein Smg (DUF494 family)